MLPDAPETPRRVFTPLSMDKVVAPLVAQLSVADQPAGMLDCDRYRAAMGTEPEGGAELTTSTLES